VLKTSIKKNLKLFIYFLSIAWLVWPGYYDRYTPVTILINARLATKLVAIHPIIFQVKYNSKMSHWDRLG